MLTVKLLPAGYGDCILLSLGEHDKYNILIDGGVAGTYSKRIGKELEQIWKKGEKINLMICTHMDNDHIAGLVEVLKNEDRKLIDQIWYNGFLQIVDEKFYRKRTIVDEKKRMEDETVLNRIISQGTITESEQEVGIHEGMALGVLIEQNRIPLNAIVNGRAVSADNLPDKIKIDKTTSISVVGPSKENLNEVESNWKQDMVARNYSFRVSDKIKLMEAFEYQMERIKKFYSNEKTKVSQIEELEKYMGTLTETDESPTNKSSISFILEHGKKQYLFLGDAAVDGKLLQNIEKIVGYQHQFTAIKLPHHGSRYNITREFIDRYPAEEYYCLTNSKRYSHPDLEVLAAIACRNQQKKRFIFNYPIKKAEFLDREEWKSKYNYEIVMGDVENGVWRNYI